MLSGRDADADIVLGLE
jgi:DNA-binding response OmpR family regulator